MNTIINNKYLKHLETFLRLDLNGIESNAMKNHI